MNNQFANLMNKTSKTGEKCDTCTDFQDWMKQQNNSSQANSSKSQSFKEQPTITPSEERPLFRDEYGRVAWTYLHTMAAYYPTNPTAEQKSGMNQFINTFTEFFPCKECAEDFKDEIQKSPPRVNSRHDLSQWFCEQHNIVNRKLDKKEFDCSKVLERWRMNFKS